MLNLNEKLVSIYICDFSKVPSFIIDAFFSNIEYKERLLVTTFCFLNGISLEQMDNLLSKINFNFVGDKAICIMIFSNKYLLFILYNKKYCILFEWKNKGKKYIMNVFFSRNQFFLEGVISFIGQKS